MGWYGSVWVQTSNIRCKKLFGKKINTVWLPTLNNKETNHDLLLREYCYYYNYNESLTSNTYKHKLYL